MRCRLPSLVALSLHDEQGCETATVVKGESGRRLRLRVFEGLPPQGEADNQNSDGASSQWQFAILSESEDQQPALESTTKAAADSSADENEEENSEVPDQLRMTEVIAENSTGLAWFRGLALPSNSLVGCYHIICDSLDDTGDHVLVPSALLVVNVTE
ncbi:hypothetical protein PINS_up013441 [Pythium insidiosum]|nr:hypothetical protein PINS_up013441 [Pythium insidiosum]